MEKKALRVGKFNIVDIIAVILVVLVVCYGAFRLLRQDDTPAVTVHITYRVRAEGVPAELYDNCQSYLNSTLMDKNGLLDGKIESVEKEPYLVLDSEGNWVEDPDHANLYFTCSANVSMESPMYTKVGEQEVRVGKEYILKSEYIELAKTYIVETRWDD